MKNLLKKTWVILLTAVITALFFGGCGTPEAERQDPEAELTESSLPPETEAALDLDGIPEELVALLGRNPETEDFVISYLTEKDKEHEIDLSEYKDCSKPPHLLQWDKRWGYEQYGDGMMALTGCGPVCLSMAAIYTNADTGLDPLTVARYAENNGYYQAGAGTSWSFMTEGAKGLGIDSEEIPLVKSKIMGYLEEGRPIIASMGPGDFTTAGHYILFCGAEDGKIAVNDPNSIIRSQTLWSYEQLESQIRNIWVIG